LWLWYDGGGGGRHIDIPQKKRAGRCGSALFIVFFFKTVITLKLKLQMRLCSCPLESMYCLKKFPGVHYLRKMLLQCPFNKAQFLQNMLDNFNIITTFPYLPTNAVLESKHTLLNKSNLPLGQCRVFLHGQYPNKI